MNELYWRLNLKELALKDVRLASNQP